MRRCVMTRRHLSHRGSLAAVIVRFSASNDHEQRLQTTSDNSQATDVRLSSIRLGCDSDGRRRRRLDSAARRPAETSITVSTKCRSLGASVSLHTSMDRAVYSSHVPLQIERTCPYISSLVALQRWPNIVSTT